MSARILSRAGRSTKARRCSIGSIFALAPFVGAALADLLGSYSEAFLVLAGLAAGAALLMVWAAPRDLP